MILQIIDRCFSIYKVKEIPMKFLNNEFTFISTTDNELSIISESHLVPDDILKVENGWKCLRIAEDASFEKYGMIAFLANIIAAQKTSTLVVGTYDTDYLFIKQEKFEQVIQALKDNDCKFI
ncbi:ACT domain-containing protein [Lacrimispora brassicae]